ncbi:MAG: hypothetical protein ACKPBV_10735 [Sphaerospermopsis kisseleviana]
MSMIPDALIVPSECAPTSLDIKRALLSYNKVLIVSPSDRDVIPSRTFGLALGMPPIMSWEMGPVMPMGKAPGYDNQIDELVDAFSEAISEGALEIISTFSEISPGSMLIGSVGVDNYPLNPQAVFWIFRSMAADQELMRAVLEDDYLASLSNREDVLSLGLEGCGAGQINDIPRLPLIEKYYDDDDLREAISRICYARLGSLVKYVGYCQEKENVPILPSEGYQKIVNHLLHNSSSIIRQNAGPDDSFWVRLNRMQRVIHEDLVDASILADAQVKDILRLRDTKWLDTMTAKERLFESIRHLALDTKLDDEFGEKTSEEIASYLSVAESLESEWKKIRLKLTCEVGVASILAAPKVVGEITQISNGIGSAELILIAGGVWFLQQVKELGSEIIQLQEREEKLKRGVGFGLTKAYPSLRRKSR